MLTGSQCNATLSNRMQCGNQREADSDYCALHNQITERINVDETIPTQASEPTQTTDEQQKESKEA